MIVPRSVCTVAPPLDFTSRQGLVVSILVVCRCSVSLSGWMPGGKMGSTCAGGGAGQSKTLQLLNQGDRVWVNVPGGYGYVGVGEVIGCALPASTFRVPTPQGEVPLLDVAKCGTYHREFVISLSCGKFDFLVHTKSENFTRV